jgi:ssDNA-binding Zn-finger/Zn-ribbon topoisomerase 1
MSAGASEGPASLLSGAADMKLHALPQGTKCPYCGTASLVFVRHKRQGDIYRCTGATPCRGHSLHHRRNRAAGGVSAESTIGALNWTECPNQDPAPEVRSRRIRHRGILPGS